MKKITTDDVVQFLKENGEGDTLVGEYPGKNDKLMRILCFRCGEIYESTWGRLNAGSRCRACGIKSSAKSKRNNKDDVVSFIIRNGFSIVEDFEYKNNNTKIKIEDSIGYRYSIPFSNFKSICNKKGERGVAAFDSGNPYSLYNLVIWMKNKKFTSKPVGGTYKNGNSKTIDFQCKHGHLFTTSLRCIWSCNPETGGCPVCAGRQVIYENSFGVRFPQLLNEWSDKNIISPYEISWGTAKTKVYWICPNGHRDYLCTPANRRAGKGCPTCVGRHSDEHNLALSFPELLNEWNYERNGSPEEYSPFSLDYVWWTCSECGHEWQSTISNRSRHGNGCKKCQSISKGEDKIDKWILENSDKLSEIGIIEYKYQKSFDDCIDKRKLHFDFGLLYENGEWVLIEYQGVLHYKESNRFGGVEKLKDTQKKDKIKKTYCRKKNIKLIEIRYEDYKNIEIILEQEILLERRLNA